MGKELKITSINIFEYLGCNGDLKSSLSDYYVKNHDCVILLATDHSDDQVGLLVYQEKPVIEILYVKANDRSAKKELIGHLIRSSGKMIRYRIVNSEDTVKLAVDLGFRHESDLDIYHSKDSNHPDTVKFLDKYNRVYDSLIRRGCIAKSFEDLTQEELNQIKYDPDNEFASEFKPSDFLDNDFSGLSKRISTAVVKNDKVVAYSLLRSLGNNKNIFEILCVAKSHRKTSAIVPAIMHSLNAMIEEGLTCITFAVYQKNTEMNKVIEKNASKVIESVTVQHNMIFIRPRSLIPDQK